LTNGIILGKVKTIEETSYGVIVSKIIQSNNGKYAVEFPQQNEIILIPKDMFIKNVYHKFTLTKKSELRKPTMNWIRIHGYLLLPL
jgi:hypothetical protein